MITTAGIATTVTLATTAIVLWLVKYSLGIRRQMKKYAHIPGPEPPAGLKGFFFGNIQDVIDQDRKGVSFTQYLSELVHVYGKTFKIRFMNDIMLFTIEPNLVKEIYIEKNFKKPLKNYSLVGFPGGERYLGNGLVTEVDHERWKHRRALFNPGFQRQVLMSFMDEFNEKADILVDFLKKQADGKTEVVLLEQFNRTALDIIAKVAFDMKLDSVNNPENKFNEYIFESLSSLKYYFQDPFIKYKPHKWPLIKKHRHSIRYLRETGRKQILERLEMIKNSQDLPNDILTTILKSHENEEFDLETMVDDFITFFIAGQETTATMLSSLFLELGRNPNALEKLKNEIDAVIGTKSTISFDDLHALKYTSCCIKEALRLWPPAPQITRRCDSDLQSEKFFIPSGTRIAVWAATRETISLTLTDCIDALKFNPDRFVKNAKTDSVTENMISNYVYYPFSLGPRNCIGQNFAQIEAKVLIAKFIQNFNYKLDPNQSFAATQAGRKRPRASSVLNYKIYFYCQAR